jgi:rhodanese-related sulfurtransferase
MLRHYALAILAVALISPQAASAQDDISSPKLRIDWQEFKKLYDARKVEVIDVRGEAAFADAHVPGARSVPLDQVEKQAAALRKLGKPLVIYCA